MFDSRSKTVKSQCPVTDIRSFSILLHTPTIHITVYYLIWYVF